MHKKRGIFFTIDAILAAGIFFVLILLISNVYVSDTPTQQVRFYSQDTLRLFTELKINEVDSDYVRNLIGSGTITELNNTILEQVGDFWAENEIDNAEGLMKNLTDALIPQNYGVGVYVDDDVIYARQRSIGRTLISSRKIISGVAEGIDGDALPGLWGPVVIEFRVWETTDLKDLVCLQTDVSCGTYPACNNCDSQDSYSSNYCSGNSILRDFSDYSCASSSCTSSTNPETVENCASSNGICQSAACVCADTGSSCGTYSLGCQICGVGQTCQSGACVNAVAEFSAAYSNLQQDAGSPPSGFGGGHWWYFDVTLSENGGIVGITVDQRQKCYNSPQYGDWCDPVKTDIAEKFGTNYIPAGEQIIRNNDWVWLNSGFSATVTDTYWGVDDNNNNLQASYSFSYVSN